MPHRQKFSLFRSRSRRRGIGLARLRVAGLIVVVLSQLGCTDRAERSQATRTATEPHAAQSTTDQGLGASQRPEPAATKAAHRQPPPESIQLFDVVQQSGIDFVHSSGSQGQFLLPETMTGGVALLDYDCDGLLDVYFCGGRKLLDASSNLLDMSSKLVDVSSIGSRASAGPDRGHVGGGLFKNLGQLRFVDVTDAAGLATTSFGLGVAVGDYDNDGYVDLFLTNFGGDLLYRNRGDGTFENGTSQLGGALGQRFSAGASFVDVDNDGLLDLFVARYVALLPEQLPGQAGLRRTMYPGPQDFPAETCKLMINLGGHDATGLVWRDASHTSQIDSASGTGMGVVAGDFDGDGDRDIYVANDELPNSLFINDGHGQFEESALAMGAAVDAVGAASGSMGVDAGDLDNDGLPELFVTTFENELVKLFRMNEQKLFQDVTRQTKIGEGTLPHVTWGCSIGDLDNDGDRDLYVATGHLDGRNQNKYYRVADLVLKNGWRETGQLRFENVASRCGDIASVQRTGRGTAIGDLDQDGDLDVVVNNLDDQPSLLQNRSATQHHWLQVQLIGRQDNRDAQGAKVRVQVGQVWLVDEIRSGRGYQSSWSGPLHFGLGDATRCPQLEITWPNGRQQTLTDIRGDQLVQVVQP